MRDDAGALAGLLLLGFALVAYGVADAARLFGMLAGGPPPAAALPLDVAGALASLALARFVTALHSGGLTVLASLAVAARRAGPYAAGGAALLCARALMGPPDAAAAAALLVLGVGGAISTAAGAVLATRTDARFPRRSLQ